jgi:AcrR family transcriptional regulator
MTDRRVRRTRDTLRRALVDLTLEKGYQKVTVQDILDRADVGRSTFYAHYQSKDDLLLSGYDDLLAEFLEEARRVPDDVLSPIRALLRFVHERREVYRTVILGHELAARPARTNIEAAVTDHLRTRLTVDEEELASVVTFLMSGLFGMVAWWLGTNSALSPDELYERFQRLAMTGLAPLST